MNHHPGHATPQQKATLLTLALLLCSTPMSLAQSIDRVRLLTGRTESGTVAKTNANWIELTDRKDVKKQIPTPDIASVLLAGAPSSMRTAQTAINNGRFEDARTALQKIDASAVSRSIILQEIEMLGILCDRQLARNKVQLAAAAKRAIAFQSSHRTSFHFYEVAQIIGDLALSLEKYDGAKKAYAQIGNAPWPSYQLRSNVLQGKALLFGGNASEAEAFFDKAIAAKAEDETAKREQLLAKLGKAACLIENGDADGAIAQTEKLITDGDAKDSVLFARAYNVLGAAYNKQGDTKGALLAYLHVDLLFNSDADAHAEALFHLSTLWATERRPDRAADSRELLKSQYPASRWASREK